MQIETKKFNELFVLQLYNIYKLRSAVFVVEQNCPYQDPDEKDPLAYHLTIYENHTLAAYARILPPGVSYPEPSIGRVVVSPHFRAQGYGKILMKKCIDETLRLFDNAEIVISAQTYLLKFYTTLGFAAESEIYSEDNIPHIQMRLTRSFK